MAMIHISWHFWNWFIDAVMLSAMTSRVQVMAQFNDRGGNNKWLMHCKVPVPTSGSMDYALSFRPEYHQAILDVIIHYGWKKIIYIYDSHDGEFQQTLLTIFSVTICIVLSVWLVFSSATQTIPREIQLPGISRSSLTAGSIKISRKHDSEIVGLFHGIDGILREWSFFGATMWIINFIVQPDRFPFLSI